MPTKLSELEGFFKALADATRLRILGLLLTGEVCVCHIHESLKIPQPKTSRHLAYLRRAGLVETRRDGLWVYYRMARLPDPVLRAVSEAVTHALTHVPVVHRDASRLTKKTGCCLPDATAAAGAPCCAAPAGALPVETANNDGADRRSSSEAVLGLRR
jgi:ArsR family transcriptional regulator, arsenate/arsenite/antimonite-responsive transcriptional repressor